MSSRGRGAQTRTENLGHGIRVDHRATCRASHPKCACPKSWARPQRGGKRRPRRTGFIGTLRDAKAEKAAEYLAARSEEPDAPTLHGWCAQVLRLKEGTVKPSTFDGYAYAYEARIHDDLGSLRLDAITPLVIDDWIAARIAKEGNTPSVFKAYQFLRVSLRMAAKKRVIEFDPTSAVDFPTNDRPPVRESRDRAVTSEQYTELLAVCTLARHRLMVRLAVEAGLRSGELAGLRFQHLDLDSNHPSILVEENVTTSRRTRKKIVGSPKSNKAGTVAISKQLAFELARYWTWLEATEGVTETSYLFPGRIGRSGPTSHDHPQGRWTPGNTVEKLCARAGLVNDEGKSLTTPHGLRATGATIAAEAGVNPLVIQHQLRHAELRTTQKHYIGAPPPAVLGEFATAFE